MLPFKLGRPDATVSGRGRKATEIAKRHNMYGLLKKSRRHLPSPSARDSASSVTGATLEVDEVSVAAMRQLLIGPHVLPGPGT